MNKPRDITLAKPIDEIVDHLRSLVSNDKRGEFSIVRQGFQELVGHRVFTNSQMRTIFRHASDNARLGIDGSLSQTWLLFRDGLAQSMMSYTQPTPEQSLTPLLNAIVISRWNAENFPKLLDFEVPEKVPSYPASMQQLFDFRLVPAYIDRSVIPELKLAMAEHFGIEATALEEMVAAREKALIEGRVHGYDALMPIKAWSSGKRRASQSSDGPEVKPL